MTKSAEMKTMEESVVKLSLDEVYRVNRADGARRVQVEHGTIWLTGTPASNDTILSEGDDFQFTDNWPFVIQALEETEIKLVE